MSYIANERSVSGAQPIECYEFIAPHNTWRYTSYHSEVTVDGDLYLPLPITRTATELTSIIDSLTTMDFNIPADHEIARQFCYTVSPKTLVIIVRRVYEGDDFSTEFKIEWRGRYAGASANKKWGVIKTASIIQTELNGYLSSIYYQKVCNHVLFDARCKVLRNDFTQTAIVTKVQNQIITVDNMVYAVDELINGTMVNTRTGEVQGIISNVSNVLRIGYPFFDIIVGDIVELTLGCNHLRLGHCKTRFDNVDNYGGFDFVPEVNPFEKLVYTVATRTETTADGEIREKPRILAQGGTAVRASGRRTTQSTSALGRAPKPKPTSLRSSEFSSSDSEGSGNIPQAQLGVAVSAILGQKLVPNHNLIWTGNLRAITQTVSAIETWEEEIDHGGGYIETITHTETTYTTTTIGYFVDIMLGICLGPDTHLIGIYVDGESVWSGDVGPARTLITIPDGETFISGASLYFSGGNFDQTPEPLVTTPDFPAHVGIATIFMENIRADLTMGQMSFEVVRIPNPLALSDANNKIGNDLNIVSAFVEVVTNEWGYGGLDISNVDTATFSTLAVTTKNEGNVCSIKIDNDVGINEVLGAILDQAYMVSFENPETGKITGKLIRVSSIDYATLPRFTDSNISELRNWEKTGWQETLEQARGIYKERDAEYNDVPVFIQNAANISLSGRGKRTVTFNYPFVPTRELATALLSRDMAALSAPNYAFSVLTNRYGASVLPGDIVTVSWSDYSLLNLLMRVISTRKQDITNNSVVLSLKQVKFPDTPNYTSDGDPFDPGFNVSPQTPTDVAILTAPYYMVRARTGLTASNSNPLNFPLFLPNPANAFQASYTTFINNLPGSDEPIVVMDGVGFPTTGLLNGSIDIYDGFVSGEISTIDIDGVINPGLLVDIAETGVRAGRLFMFIGDEILSFEGVTNNGGGSWTLDNVHRGLLDTVAQSHADNSNVYIIANNFNNVARNGYPYPVGYTPEWSIVSNGVIEPGYIGDALISTDWAPTVLRTLAPPRPHNTMVEGQPRDAIPVVVTEGVSTTVTWSTRVRIATDIKLQLDAPEAPELNGSNTQKHRIFHRSGGGIVTEIGTMAYTGDTATFTMPNVTDGVGSIYVQAELEIGGVLYTSIAQDRIPVEVIGVHARITEDGILRRTEAGDNREIE